MDQRLQDYLLKIFGNQPVEPIATGANLALAARAIPEEDTSRQPIPTGNVPPEAAPLDQALPPAPAAPQAAMPAARPTMPPVAPPLPGKAAIPAPMAPSSQYDDNARKALYDQLVAKRAGNAGWEAIGNVADLNSRVGGGTPLNAHQGMMEKSANDEAMARKDFEAGATRESNVRDYLEKKREKDQTNTRESARDAELAKYHQGELDIKRLALKQKTDKPAPGTAAENATDKAFAHDYNDFVLQGGRRAVEGNFKKLDQSIKDLEQLDPGMIRRSIATVTPEGARGLVQPGYKSIEQDARANVVGLLRATLGAQFTEKEGERIFAQTFDPSLPAETNLRKLRTLRNSLQGQAADKQAAIDYYEENGTLKGFKSSGPAQGASRPAPTAAGTPPQGWKVVR